jgi:hypothetical protein
MKQELVLRDTEKGRKPARETDEEVNLAAVARFMERWGFPCRVVKVLNEDIDGKRQCVLCMEMHPVETFTLRKARSSQAAAKIAKHSKDDKSLHVVRVCTECMKYSSWNAGAGVS